jgi:hypothetical protein
MLPAACRFQVTGKNVIPLQQLSQGASHQAHGPHENHCGPHHQPHLIHRNKGGNNVDNGLRTHSSKQPDRFRRPATETRIMALMLGEKIVVYMYGDMYKKMGC